MDLFEAPHNFSSLFEVLQPLALRPYQAGLVLGRVDSLAMLVIFKLFTEHSGLADIRQRERDFLEEDLEQDLLAVDIPNTINMNELVAVVGGVITATYGNPPALDGRRLSFAVEELEVNVSTKLFQIAWQVVELDTEEDTILFSAGFTALRPEEAVRAGDALRDVELQVAGELIRVSEVTTPCEQPLLEELVCTVCQCEFGASGREAEELEEGELLNMKPVKTRCEHVFHENCLGRWVNSAMGNSNRCPICRMALCARRPWEAVESVERDDGGEVPDSWWDR